VDVATELVFGDELILLGHDALPPTVASGGRFEVKSYWRALEPGGPDYGVKVSVLDPEGVRWSGDDIRPPRWHRAPPPAGEWGPDEYVLVALAVPVHLGTPPGDYLVEAVAFDRRTLMPLTAHDAAGRALGPGITLGQIRVTPPRRPPDPDELRLPARMNVHMGPLTLADAHLDRREAAPGDPVLVSTLWRAHERPADDLAVHLAVVTPGETTAASYILPPSAAWYPTSVWKEGDLWLGQHPLRLPAHLLAGDYRWVLKVCPQAARSCAPVGPEVDLGPFAVKPITRTWTPPAVDYATEAELGRVATLLGASLAPDLGTLSPGATVTVTLVWRAESEVGDSYRVFLHLLGPEGALVAQSDGEPANWTRPTTGWVTGEIILDERTLTLSDTAQPGRHSLRAGLYLPGTGRLKTGRGDDGVTVASLSVGSGE
jgi:hypothetical protein